jgi:hypothetical protein
MGHAFAHKAKPAPATGSSTQRAPAVPPIVHDVLRSPGQPLDSATRAHMEPRFGHDFSKVRVHADDRAAEAASLISARAFTSNRGLVFGAGEYAPQTESGRRLLSHELTHVVQQQAGVRLNDGVGQAGDGYELHAEVVANHVARGKSATDLLSRVVGPAIPNIQRQAIGHEYGGAPAVSTYVAVPSSRDMENRLKFGAGNRRNSAPSLFSRFAEMLRTLDKVLQGNATQSWGLIIYGGGDGRDSPATKASKDAKILGSFDYKEFMEIMGLVLDAIPERSSYREILEDLHDKMGKKEVDKLAESVFETVRDLEELKEELRVDDTKDGAKTSEITHPFNLDVKVAPDKPTKRATTQQKVEEGQWVAYDKAGNQYLMTKYRDGSKGFVFGSIYGSKDIGDPGLMDWKRVR